MSISPETLLEERESERRHRQARTGVMGAGLTVDCRPSLEDRMVMQMQNRSVCLYRPHPGCQICPHASFTLFFDAQKNRYDQVACPRWDKAGSRLHGESPDSYRVVELATCEDRPFDFCASCPSMNEVAQFGADKAQPGWYTRWRRLARGDDDE
jgi:hypothetical protein